MEHTRASFVRLLTLFGIGSVFPKGRTGETLVADHKLLDPPVRHTEPEAVRDLLKEVLSLAEEADKIEVGVSLGSLSRAERRRRLYG